MISIHKERSSVPPPITRGLASIIAGGLGLIVGGILGLVAGAPGVIAGALLGAATGAALGATMEREHKRYARKDEALDREIGVIGGNMGRK